MDRVVRRCGACVVAVVVLVGWLAGASGALASGGQLQWGGGPVVHSAAPYLVFWTPSGESIPASSESLLGRYLSDVAAKSGTSGNVFAVDRQYHDSTGFADYRQTFNPARQVIVDSQPYPPRDGMLCPYVAAAYPTCVSDLQVQSELHRLITAHGLPTAGRWNAAELSATAPIYLVVVPGDVNVCYLGATHCFDTNSCGYHENFVAGRSGTVLYAVIPIQMHAITRGVVWPKECQYDGNSVGQEPNGDNADVVINHLSHELNETITDPIGTGWVNTSTMNEDGDNCEGYGPLAPPALNNPNAFSPTLGGSATAGTLYTQLINGHPYYTQSEWSNGNHNCEMRPSPGRIAPRFTVPRSKHIAGASLTFDPAASTSKNPLSSATWNFGDGSKTAFLSGHAARNRVKHRYRRAGRYTITLTLVDNRGNLQSTSRRVTVHPR